MKRPHFPTTNLIALLAFIELVFGVVMVTAPADFRASVWGPLGPFFPNFSAALFIGAGLLAVLCFRSLAVTSERALFLVGVLPLLLTSGYLGAASGWLGIIEYSLPLVTMIVVSWVALTRYAYGDHLLIVALGALESLLGTLVLLQPDSIMPYLTPMDEHGLLLLGSVALIGGVMLMFRAPGAVEIRWYEWLRRMVGALLPLTMVVFFGWLGRWSHAAGWASWLAALAIPPTVHRAVSESEPDVEDQVSFGLDWSEPLLSVLEQMMYAWIWLLLLVVVALTALGGSSGVISPQVAVFFVVVVSIYNIFAFWVYPHVGSLESRLFTHFVFLVTAVGVLFAGVGPAGRGLLAVLAVIPPLAARALGLSAGARLAGLAAVLITGGEVAKWLSGMSTLSMAIGRSVVDIHILAVASVIGFVSAREQRQFVRDLGDARLELHRQVKQLQLVDRIGGSVRHSLDLDEVLRTTVTELGQVIEACCCHILLQDAQGRWRVAHEFYQDGVDCAEVNMLELPFQQAGVPQTDGPVIIPDVSTAHQLEGYEAIREQLLQAGIHAVLLAPLVAQGNQLGLIVFCQSTSRHWTTQEIDFLDAVAGQAAVAVSHARIYKALAESEERFRLLVELSPDAVVVHRGAKIVFVNPATAKLVGAASPQEVVGRSLWEFAHPQSRQQFLYMMSMLNGQGSVAPATEMKAMKLDGSQMFVEVSAATVVYGGHQAVQLIVRDITERKRFEHQVFDLANYDPLTRLFNRRRFKEEVDRHLKATRERVPTGALMIVDLDQFKYINNSFGHHGGDQLLTSIAMLLKKRMRETDTVGHLGGDEFAILLPGVARPHAEVIARDILQMVRNHTQIISGQPVSVTASMGVALYPECGKTFEDLLAHADLAVHSAKGRGRNLFAFYTEELERRMEPGSKLAWERRIQHALDHDRFVLHWQPILDLRRGSVNQYELLLRMVGDDGKLIYPNAFLEVAEDFGLIHAIDRWVVNHAVRTLKRYRAAGHDISLEVNVSGKVFEDPEMLPMIRRLLVQTGINPSALVLEITETAAIGDLHHARKFVETLKSLGCRFAIDDFGTGFASFAHLKHLPVDYLKLDGSFVRDLPHNQADRHLVRAMVEVARGLNKKTIAEFVTNQETLDILKQYGVDYAQGNYIGRPDSPGKYVSLSDAQYLG